MCMMNSGCASAWVQTDRPGSPWKFAAFLCLLVAVATPSARAENLRVMATGLGGGTVTSNPAGINCGASCDAMFGSGSSVTLTATPAPGSQFVRWEGDASGTTNPTTVTMSADRSVRAVFGPTTPIPAITDFTPGGLQTYLTAHPEVNSPGRFVGALPVEFKRNWILMTRSESLQTGTAESPRLLLPSADARAVFTIGLTPHVSFPGSSPLAIEYMQWDAAEKNFRFHEIALDSIPAMGVYPPRSRGVSFDDNKCSKCHSTRNVLNLSPFPGTTGIPPGVVKVKNKPNWDTYDSWGGMMPFNRDRIYQGSVEAAAFRRLMNPWTWRGNETVRAVIEQLELQPPGIPPDDEITRISGGPNDGHIHFAFDAASPILSEPAPVGNQPNVSTNYEFNREVGTGAASTVVRQGAFVTLHHSAIPLSDEGRGVRLFDALGGAAGNLNSQRIADELISHRFATGSVPIDVRPIAYAITKGLVQYDAVSQDISGPPGLSVDRSFFNTRHGNKTLKDLVDNTRERAVQLTRRKADIQRLNLDRAGDVYLSTLPGGNANGLLQQYGAATAGGTSATLERLRQEIFRRSIGPGFPDSTAQLGGIYVDRELYIDNTHPVALYRYFLEPLGVSVDKWSMGVRGRSRTYTFADVFQYYINPLQGAIRASLVAEPVPGMTNPDDETQLINAINATLGALPAADAVPTYTDVQRIFNKSCIDCHGGLDYPPYRNYGSYLDLSEDENPPAMAPPLPNPRLARSYDRAIAYTTTDPATSLLFQKLIRPSEECPDFATGMMPCGGPNLSSCDIDTIRRWIVGPPARPATVGDPHIRTVDGIAYDFQADGEFVFLRSEGLEIQVRQTAVETAAPVGPNEHTGLTTCVSINTAVAVRVGQHRISYQPNPNGVPDPKGLQLRIDGQVRDLGPGGITLGTGGRLVPTIAPGGIQIEGPGGSVVVVTPGWWENYQVWYLDIDLQHVRAIEGLAGTIAPGNWLPALPDGTLLGPRPESLPERHRVLYQRFGNAWRVTDATSLFAYAPGTSTKTFALPVWPGPEGAGGCQVPPRPGGMAQRPPQPPIVRAEAEKLVRDIRDPFRKASALADIMATGEVGFAKTYLLADRIARNQAPAAPVLVGPKEGQKDVGTDITFTWQPSRDPEGRPVVYRQYVWPVQEAPNANDAVVIPASAVDAAKGLVTRSVSRLVPGKAYFWKVIAEDDAGGVVESETRRFEVK